MAKGKFNKSDIDPRFGVRGKPNDVGTALNNTNPNYYSNEGKEWKINCTHCVYAYEMQRRGYNVEATPRYEDDLDEVALNYRTVMKGQTWQKANALNVKGRGIAKKIDSQMTQWGDGTRAVIKVVWKGGKEGHVFIAEQRKGQTHYLDPQVGRSISLNWYLDHSIKGQTEISRIDNLEPTSLIHEAAQKRR